MPDVRRCPTCNGRWPEKQVQQFARICRSCKQPIRTHHKWMVQTDGEASWFVHRNCSDPTSYGEHYPSGHSLNPRRQPQ